MTLWNKKTDDKKTKNKGMMRKVFNKRKNLRR